MPYHLVKLWLLEREACPSFLGGPTMATWLGDGPAGEVKGAFQTLV